MKSIVVLLVVVFLAVISVCAQSPAPVPIADTGCLIVKHKGTVGRRLLFMALIRLPIAPGAKYDLVEAFRVPDARLDYKGKDLQALQAERNIHVIVLEQKYRLEDLTAARAECQGLEAPTLKK